MIVKTNKMESSNLLRKRPSISPQPVSIINSDSLTKSKIKNFFDKVPEFKNFIKEHGIDYDEYIQNLFDFHVSGKRFMRIKPYLDLELKSNFIEFFNKRKGHI
jgi:hypothetical protein